MLNELITNINDALWTYVLIGALVGCGLWFTWKTHFVQFRMIGEMIRLLGEATTSNGKGRRHVSSCQAFAVSVATRGGTGFISLLVIIHQFA